MPKYIWTEIRYKPIKDIQIEMSAKINFVLNSESLFKRLYSAAVFKDLLLETRS